MSKKCGRKRQDYVRKEYYEPFINGLKRSRSNDRKSTLSLMYQRIFSEMCVNRFKWEGLPDTIDERFLEKTLFEDALCVFYFDTQYDRYLALRGGSRGIQNMYDNPTSFIVTGNTMINKTLSFSECEPIWSNALRMPDWDIVATFSDRLAEIETSFDINLMHARHPFLIGANVNEKMTLVNAYRQVAEGEPVIFGTDSLASTLGEKISVFNTGVDYRTLESLQTVRTRVWQQALGLLGIMTVNDEKKERMVVDEATGNSGQVLAMRGIALNARREACERINKRYGLAVSVDWNLDEKGGIDNGGLYD